MNILTERLATKSSLGKVMAEAAFGTIPELPCDRDTANTTHRLTGRLSSTKDLAARPINVDAINTMSGNASGADKIANRSRELLRSGRDKIKAGG